VTFDQAAQDAVFLGRQVQRAARGRLLAGCFFMTRSGSQQRCGHERFAERNQLWDKVAQRVTAALKGGKCRVEAAKLSPAGRYLAACVESKTMLGLREHHVGAIYDLADDAIIGRLAQGKRAATAWAAS
jgi:hypothetical protein